MPLSQGESGNYFSKKFDLELVALIALFCLCYTFIFSIGLAPSEQLEWKALLLSPAIGLAFFVIGILGKKLVLPYHVLLGLLVASFFYLLFGFNFSCSVQIVGLAILHWILITVLRKNLEVLESFFNFVSILIFWITSSKIFWWGEISEIINLNIGISLLILIGLLSLIVHKLPYLRSASRTSASIFDIVAIVVLALLSFSSAAFNQLDFLHHAGVFASSAHLVRQGGLLLFDTPSQYGFLNILLIALLPFKSVYDSLSATNGTLNCFFAIIIYFLLRKGFDSKLLSFPFCLIATVIFVFLIPGNSYSISGSTLYPSLGAMRFFWACSLVLVFWVFEDSKIKFGQFVIASASICCIGVFWSFESAVLSLSVFGAASLGLLLSGKLRIANFLRLSGCCFLFYIFLIGSLSALYHFKYGITPRFSSYTDYVFAFKSGFGTLPIDVNGPVWILVVGFALLLITLKTSRENKLGTYLGLVMLYWQSSAYFVSRSHSNNVLNLFPVLIFCFAVILSIEKNELKHKLGNFLISLLCISIISIAYNTADLKRFVGDLLKFQFITTKFTLSANSLSPKLKAELPKLQNYISNNFRKNDYILVLDNGRNLLDPEIYGPEGALSFKPFLPFTSMASFLPIEGELFNYYLMNYAKRFRQSGKIILPNSRRNRKDFKLLSKDLRDLYRVRLNKTLGHWRIYSINLR